MSNLSKSFLLVIFLIAGVTLYSQENENQMNQEKKAAISAFLDTFQVESSIFPDTLKEVYRKDSTVLAKYYESLIQYFDYRISGYKHRERVFSWQLFSSKVIFFSVLFLLIVGVYFSYLQFRKAMKGDSSETLSTDLEASAQGFKVSSPVLGVIILVISLIFFYLYLVYIYPIREIF